MSKVIMEALIVEGGPNMLLIDGAGMASALEAATFTPASRVVVENLSGENVRLLGVR